MKKIDVLKICLIVMLLCTTSIFTIAVNNEASALDTSRLENQIYVDPNIMLVKKDLFKFEKALRKITDPQYKEMAEKIIKIIEVKGYADSNDIKNILIELGMTDTGVYSGRISGSDMRGGSAYAIKQIGFNIGWVGWYGRQLYLEWKATGPWVDFTVDVDHITYPHRGAVFPFFFGGWSTGIYSISPWVSWCKVHGSGFLIWITPI